MASLILEDTQIDDDEHPTDSVMVLNEDDDEIDDVECDVMLDVDRVNDGVWVDVVHDVEVDLVDCFVDAIVAYDVDGFDVLNVDVMLMVDVDYVDDVDPIDVCDDVLGGDQ